MKINDMLSRAEKIHITLDLTPTEEIIAIKKCRLNLHMCTNFSPETTVVDDAKFGFGRINKNTECRF